MLKYIGKKVLIAIATVFAGNGNILFNEADSG